MAHARDKLVQLMSVMALSLTPAVTAGPVVLTIDDVSAPAGVAGLSNAVHTGTVATPSLASMMLAGHEDSLCTFITTRGSGWAYSSKLFNSSHSAHWQAVYTSEESRAEAFDLSDGFVQIVGAEASLFKLFEVGARGRGRSASVGGIALVSNSGFLDRPAPPPPASTPLPSAGLMACAGLVLLGARRRR